MFFGFATKIAPLDKVGEQKRDWQVGEEEEEASMMMSFGPVLKVGVDRMVDLMLKVETTQKDSILVD